VWFSESHIVLIISFLLFVLFTQFIVDKMKKVMLYSVKQLDHIFVKITQSLVNVLIKQSLLNNIITVADYCYNCLAKQHVSALRGHHQTYKTVVLVKVHSVVP